jgi:TonB family protein
MVFDARKRAEQVKNAHGAIVSSPGVSELADGSSNPQQDLPVDKSASDSESWAGTAKAPVAQQTPIVRSLLRMKRSEPLSAALHSSGRFPQDGEADRTVLISRENPLYPEIAKQHSISGTVEVHFRIRPDGTMYDIQSMKGPAILSRAVLEAMEGWRCEPAKLNGAPIDSQGITNFEFDLT